MLSTKNLYVRVLSPERISLKSAKLFLTPIDKKNDEIQLEWDGRLGLHIVPIKIRGFYTLTILGKGLETQRRTLQLPHPPTPVEVILGKKGMSYYYRGKVKTPFREEKELLGVSLNPTMKSAQRRVEEMAKKNGLKIMEVGKQIALNNVLILKFPKEYSTSKKKDIYQEMIGSGSVNCAGAVLEMFDERCVFMTSQVLVKFKANVTKEQAGKYASRYDLKLGRHLKYAGNAYLMEGPSHPDYTLLKPVNQLAELEDVEFAEPNTITTSMLFAINPNDFLIGQQWHVPLVNLPDAWQTLKDENSGIAQGQPGDLTYGDENLVIAVADTGVQSQTVGSVTSALHPDFSGNVTGGASKVVTFFDFRTMVNNNDSLISDHGMGVAGVVAAQADNPSTVAGEFEGVAGAAGNCRILGISVPFGQTNVRWADMLVWMAGLNPGWTADGVNYPAGTVFPALLTTGASIHTNSTRIPDVGICDDALDFTANFARDGRGMVSFLAAGNTAATLAHPSNNTIADHDKVLTIAASINSDVRSGYSCFDPSIDVCAPSSGDTAQTTAGALGKVTTDFINGGNLAGQTGGALNYRNNFGGTSSSTPLSAGIAALMLSIRPELNWVQVREILRNTAAKIDTANTDPIGQWTVVGTTPVFSQWYGFGRVDALAAVIGARDFGLASDVVIRDNLGDNGSVPSNGWHANSPDIWVRKTNDPIPALAYTASPPHENAIRGQDNYVYLRAKNVGTATTNEMYLRAVICHYPGFEFRYPEEWQPSIPPSAAPPVPFAPGSYLIGEQLIDNLAPGADIIVKMRWNQNLIPPSSVTIGSMNVNWHPCILAEVSPHDGPAPAGATFDVKRYNDLAHKNISIDDAGRSGGFSTHAVLAGSTSKVGVQSLVLDRSRMTPNTRVFIYCPEPRIMDVWKRLIKKGSVRTAGKLPWQRKRSNTGSKLPTKVLQESSAMTILSSTQISVQGVDGYRTIIDVPKKTKIWMELTDRRKTKPEVFIGKFENEQVIFFDSDGGDSLELPMPLVNGEHCPLVIGIQRSEDGKFGSLLATQKRNDDVFSAGYEITG